MLNNNVKKKGAKAINIISAKEQLSSREKKEKENSAKNYLSPEVVDKILECLRKAEARIKNQDLIDYIKPKLEDNGRLSEQLHKIIDHSGNHLAVLPAILDCRDLETEIPEAMKFLEEKKVKTKSNRAKSQDIEISDDELKNILKAANLLIAIKASIGSPKFEATLKKGLNGELNWFGDNPNYQQEKTKGSSKKSKSRNKVESNSPTESDQELTFTSMVHSLVTGNNKSIREKNLTTFFLNLEFDIDTIEKINTILGMEEKETKIDNNIKGNEQNKVEEEKKKKITISKKIGTDSNKDKKINDSQLKDLDDSFGLKNKNVSDFTDDDKRKSKIKEILVKAINTVNNTSEISSLSSSESSFLSQSDNSSFLAKIIAGIDEEHAHLYGMARNVHNPEDEKEYQREILRQKFILSGLLDPGSRKIIHQSIGNGQLMLSFCKEANISYRSILFGFLPEELQTIGNVEEIFADLKDESKDGNDNNDNKKDNKFERFVKATLERYRLGPEKNILEELKKLKSEGQIKLELEAVTDQLKKAIKNGNTPGVSAAWERLRKLKSENKISSESITDQLKEEIENGGKLGAGITEVLQLLSDKLDSDEGKNVPPEKTLTLLKTIWEERRNYGLNEDGLEKMFSILNDLIQDGMATSDVNGILRFISDMLNPENQKITFNDRAREGMFVLINKILDKYGNELNSDAVSSMLDAFDGAMRWKRCVFSNDDILSINKMLEHLEKSKKIDFNKFSPIQALSIERIRSFYKKSNDLASILSMMSTVLTNPLDDSATKSFFQIYQETLKLSEIKTSNEISTIFNIATIFSKKGQNFTTKQVYDLVEKCGILSKSDLEITTMAARNMFNLFLAALKIEKGDKFKAEDLFSDMNLNGIGLSFSNGKINLLCKKKSKDKISCYNYVLKIIFSILNDLIQGEMATSDVNGVLNFIGDMLNPEDQKVIFNDRAREEMLLLVNKILDKNGNELNSGAVDSMLMALVGAIKEKNITGLTTRPVLELINRVIKSRLNSGIMADLFKALVNENGVIESDDTIDSELLKDFFTLINNFAFNEQSAQGDTVRNSMLNAFFKLRQKCCKLKKEKRNKVELESKPDVVPILGQIKTFSKARKTNLLCDDVLAIVRTLESMMILGDLSQIDLNEYLPMFTEIWEDAIGMGSEPDPLSDIAQHMFGSLLFAIRDGNKDNLANLEIGDVFQLYQDILGALPEKTDAVIRPMFAGLKYALENVKNVTTTQVYNLVKGSGILSDSNFQISIGTAQIIFSVLLAVLKIENRDESKVKSLFDAIKLSDIGLVFCEGKIELLDQNKTKDKISCYACINLFYTKLEEIFKEKIFKSETKEIKKEKPKEVELPKAEKNNENESDKTNINNEIQKNDNLEKNLKDNSGNQETQTVEQVNNNQYATMIENMTVIKKKKPTLKNNQFKNDKEKNIDKAKKSKEEENKSTVENRLNSSMDNIYRGNSNNGNEYVSQLSKREKEEEKEDTKNKEDEVNIDSDNKNNTKIPTVIYQKAEEDINSGNNKNKDEQNNIINSNIDKSEEAQSLNANKEKEKVQDNNQNNIINGNINKNGGKNVNNANSNLEKKKNTTIKINSNPAPLRKNLDIIKEVNEEQEEENEKKSMGLGKELKIINHKTEKTEPNDKTTLNKKSEQENIKENPQQTTFKKLGEYFQQSKGEVSVKSYLPDYSYIGELPQSKGEVSVKSYLPDYSYIGELPQKEIKDMSAEKFLTQLIKSNVDMSKITVQALNGYFGLNITPEDVKVGFIEWLGMCLKMLFSNFGTFSKKTYHVSQHLLLNKYFSKASELLAQNKNKKASLWGLLSKLKQNDPQIQNQPEIETNKLDKQK